ncbi:MAG: ABC transporter substrate-binding protein, partial [Candidatus Devosia euplotis]|nr:ABC transporter substrate-binding protein [Candidatus Devosia euplotis]
MTLLKRGLSRRRVLQTGMAGIIGTGIALMILTRSAWAQEFCNNPTGETVTFGLNLPLTGAYAEEGADEQKAYELAIQHLNGEGDDGLINVLTPNALKGNGILGKKVAFVTFDSQTKSDAAHAGATRMIERDWAIMVTGGSSSGEVIAVQGLRQELGVIFMAGLNHPPNAAGQNKRLHRFRSLLKVNPSGRGPGPGLCKENGQDRRAHSP